MQTWYKVMGDYGPQAGDYMVFYILTSRGEEHAISLFAKRMERDFEYLWSRMGRMNTDVVATYVH